MRFFDYAFSLFFVFVVVSVAFFYLNQEYIPVDLRNTISQITNQETITTKVSEDNTSENTINYDYGYARKTDRNIYEEKYTNPNSKVSTNVKVSTETEKTTKTVSNPLNVVWDTIVGTKDKETPLASSVSDKTTTPSSGPITNLVHAPIMGGGGGVATSISSAGTGVPPTTLKSFDYSPSQIAEIACTKSLSASHPKSLPKGKDFDEWKNDVINGDLKSYYSKLKTSYSYINTNHPIQTDATLTKSSLPNYISSSLELIHETAIDWVLSNNTTARDLAKARILNFAGLDPKGISATIQTPSWTLDRESSRIVRGLAVGLDWMGDTFTIEEKAEIQSALDIRMKDFENLLLRNSSTSLYKYKNNGHGFADLAVLSTSALMTSDELDVSKNVCNEALGYYLDNKTSYYLGSDGGFGNGTAYAVFNALDLMNHLDTIKWVSGIDVYQMDPIKNFEKYFVYFIPPGAKSNPFGDGAEDNSSGMLDENRAIGIALSNRIQGNPLYAWYSSKLAFPNLTWMANVLSSVDKTTSKILPLGTENGAYFQSIGEVAMHSDLSDPNRISVFFRSGPWGNDNHNHADQNGFVITAQGLPLFIDSGYYDSYGTNHWKNWYKQTKAHNAITYDGGIGQDLGTSYINLNAKGAITQFETHTNYDITSGDATSAYGPDITSANRSLVFIRPNILVVFDKMTSTSAHSWEWNFHASSSMSIVDPSGKARVVSGSNTACLTIKSNNTLSGTFDTLFTVNPNRDASNPRPDQYHGKFTSLPSKNFISATVIDVGCTGIDPEIVVDDSSASVSVSGFTASFAGTATTVR